jgi:hypothetical protein
MSATTACGYAHQEALRAVRDESNASTEASVQLIQRRKELRDKLDLLAGEKVAQALNDGLYAIDMTAPFGADADEVKRMRTMTAEVMQGFIRIRWSHRSAAHLPDKP